MTRIMSLSLSMLRWIRGVVAHRAHGSIRAANVHSHPPYTHSCDSRATLLILGTSWTVGILLQQDLLRIGQSPYASNLFSKGLEVELS